MSLPTEYFGVFGGYEEQLSRITQQLCLGSSFEWKRHHLSSTGEEYEEPASSLDEFRVNGRECDFDDRQSTVSLLCPFQQPAEEDIIMTKNKLINILREQERKGGTARLVQGRAYRALGLAPGGGRGAQVCVFCRNNQETAAIYLSHRLKNDLGQVTCPVLYAYTCPICGAHGQDAHTIKYCPLNAMGDVQTSIIKQLKTMRTSAGRRR